LWRGRLNEKNYGVLDGEGRGSSAVLAHRASYTLNIGPIPAGMFVCHSCDNPSCVNPAHLWLGTNTDNIEDMVSKDRHQHGDGHYQAKLTAAQVVEIRYRHAHESVSQRALCAEFGVHPSTMCDVIKGRTWKHLPLCPDHPS
jgi:hypothetical protein